MEFLETDHQLDHNGKHLNIDVVCGMDVIEEKLSIRVCISEQPIIFVRIAARNTLITSLNDMSGIRCKQ